MYDYMLRISQLLIAEGFVVLNSLPDNRTMQSLNSDIVLIDFINLSTYEHYDMNGEIAEWSQSLTLQFHSLNSWSVLLPRAMKTIKALSKLGYEPIPIREVEVSNFTKMPDNTLTGFSSCVFNLDFIIAE